MSRARAERWTRKVMEEGGRRYVDHVRGSFRIEQGHDEREKAAGRPWSLFEGTRWVAAFATVKEAKAHADGTTASESEIPARRRRIT